MESIYEQDFKGFSYGARPRKSQHNALDALTIAITTKKVSYILDADIQGYYDNIDQTWLIRFLERRISDCRLLKLIKQTLKAGIIDQNQWQSSHQGIPQGAVLSPLLSNIYLHYCFDLWADEWRKKYARGEVYIIRYVDDIVMGFQYHSDGIKFHQAMKQRLGKGNLQLHPDKTKLIDFGRFAQGNRKAQGKPKPASFDFLGFTHVCAKKRNDGGFTVRRFTIAKRQRSKLKEIKGWLRQHYHDSIESQGKKLAQIIRGSMNYYGVPGNFRAMDTFRSEICKMWLRALRRRSQKASKFTWDKFKKIVNQYLPKTCIVHPYPSQRFYC